MMMRTGTYALLMSALLGSARMGRAHEGHSHGEEALQQSTQQGGPIILSEEARKNLEIRTAEATVQSIEKTFKASGTVQAIPGSRENVASKIAGRVDRLSVSLGEYKRKGDPLLILEARQLAETPVRVPVAAPRNGRVVKLGVIKGDAVEPGTPLLEIADLGEVYAVARVFESQIGLIRKGMAARVLSPFLKGKEMESKVEIVGTEVNPQSRTVEVWLRVRNPDERLKVNMTVNVFFLSEKMEEAIAVPKQAVLGTGGERFVFVVEGETYLRTPVVTGIENDRWIEVVEGLAPGDVVVIQGNYQLQFAKAKPKEAASAKGGK